MIWNNLTDKFNKVPYKLGSREYKNGLDCLSGMFRFLEGMGHDISKWNNDDYFFEFNGKKINRSNYSTVLETKEEMRAALYNFINREFTKTDKLKRGCICISRPLKNTFGIMIYLGLNNFLIITESGMTTIKKPSGDIIEVYEICL